MVGSKIMGKETIQSISHCASGMVEAVDMDMYLCQWDRNVWCLLMMGPLTEAASSKLRSIEIYSVHIQPNAAKPIRKLLHRWIMTRSRPLAVLNSIEEAFN